MQKIALFGGSFDPIHQAHLTLMQEAFKQAQLNHIYVIPNAHTPFKTTYKTPIKHRINMVNLAIQNIAYTSLSTIESEDIVHYTANTLKYFQKQYPKAQLYFIIGSDLLDKIHQWKDFTYIIQNMIFLVFPRTSHFHIQNYTVYKTYPKQFIVLQMQQIDISSTSIRKNKDSLSSSLVPEKVSEYIRENKLYH